MKIVDSILQIVHFFMPFLINFISAFVIIVKVARSHSTTRTKITYHEHLRQGFLQQKHLVISPVILVILSLPRLVFSVLPGCMKSARDPWLYLIGYFISFISPLITFIIFVLPSETYKREFDTIIKRYRTAIHRRFHLE